MSSTTAKNYGALGRSDVFLIDPRKVVIEEDDPGHPDFKAHEPRRVVNPRMLRLIRTKGAKAIGEIRIKLKKLDDGTTIVIARDGRVRLRHAREVLREKLTEMGADPETFEPTKDDPLPLLLRAVPEDDKDATLVFNSYAKKDPPLMIAQKCAEYMKQNVPIEQIEVLVNRSAGSIRKYEKLWKDSVPELKEALHADKISFNQAYRICEKSETKQREAIARIIERGAKRGRKAQEAAEGTGDGKSATPRFRAPAAKLAEQVAAMPEGTARAAVEWALGMREELPTPTTETSVTERDPDDIAEIDSLKVEILKLREDVKIARKPNVEQQRQLDGALREMVRLKDENLALRGAQVSLDVDTSPTETDDIDEKKLDVEQVLTAARGRFKTEHSGEEPSDSQREMIEWAVRFAVDFANEALEDAFADANDIAETAAAIEAEDDERQDRERLANLPTDAEIEAGIKDELRFAKQRGKLDDFLTRNPGARFVAMKHGFVEA